ncbi:unnamed protein product [Calypogeia fissa]
MEVQTSGKPIDSVLERVLCMNILSSDYFKELYRLKTYHEVIDEIYNQVDHVEPWMTGNCRGPSTAFCLLYKFFTMKLTVKQVQGLLNHGDSPYIRAVGFLYLRYVGDSKSLWGWFEQYVTDDEEFAPGSNARMTTMGLYVRDLLLDQYYFDTLLPRIPVPVMRQIVSSLERLKLSTKPAGATATESRHSTDDTARRPPSVKAALSVSFGQRAPHRASTRDFSPVRRGGSGSRDRQSWTDDQRHPHENSRYSKEGTDDRERSSRHRDRGRSRDLDRYRERSKPDREREQSREDDRKRAKVSDRSRERDRESARDSSYDRDRESSRERERRKDGDEKESDKHRDKMKHFSIDVGSTAKQESNEDVIYLGGPTWR